MGTCASTHRTEKTTKAEYYTTRTPIHQQKHTQGPVLEKKKEIHEEVNAP